MTTAADIMTTDVTYIRPTDTLTTAARLMRHHNIGALPVVTDAGELVGILTDRDIVVHGISHGYDPITTTVDSLSLQSVRTVSSESDLDSIHALMTVRRIRRLPVVDAFGTLVGIISLGDVARHTDHARLGTITEQLST